MDQWTGAGPPAGPPGGIERRRGPDRRRRPTPIFSRYTFWGGRRRGGRRAGEARNVYVDRYDWPVAALFLAILVLNVLDAHFTLLFIQRGGTEANPVAQLFLDLGHVPFILMKSAVIGVCLLFLVLHKTFLSIPRLLIGLLVFYTLLLGYHVLLQLAHLPATT